MSAKVSAISANVGSLGTNKGEAFRFGDDNSGQLAGFRAPWGKSLQYLYDVSSAAAHHDLCVEWPFVHTKVGYGKCYNPTSGKMELAHRLSFHYHNGFLPEVVMHTCDNPKCFNPAHLVAGTNAENTADSVQKNRQAYGERSGKNTLTEQDVYAIFQMKKNGKSQASIARHFGVSTATVCLIVKGKNWKHIHKEVTK